jgi:hypothetical protein
VLVQQTRDLGPPAPRQQQPGNGDPEHRQEASDDEGERVEALAGRHLLADQQPRGEKGVRPDEEGEEEDEVGKRRPAPAHARRLAADGRVARAGRPFRADRRTALCW